MYQDDQGNYAHFTDFILSFQLMPMLKFVLISDIV